MTPRATDEQKDITQSGADLKPGQNLRVIAFAGAGKSTTLKMVAKARSDRGIYLAFNKAIADEARVKLAVTRCSASTMHSLAYGAVRDLIGTPVTLNARSLMATSLLSRFNLPSVRGWGEYRIAAAVCRTLSAFANSADLEFSADHGREALVSAMGDPDLIRDKDRKEAATAAINAFAGPIAEIADAYWRHLLEDSKMSHDMYLKMLDLDEGLRSDAFRMFKYLMIDEAQDINPVQRSIVTKVGIPIIAVGDPYQQIYSWRGAENALGLLPGETKYLTQSFRFGENIAEIARHILATRPDGGPDQRLVGMGGSHPLPEAGAKVAVICRTNMGLIEEALALRKSGKRLHIDNMAGLLADVLSAQALHDGRPDLVRSATIKPYNDWAELEMEAEEGDGALSKLVRLVKNDMVGDIQDLASRQTAENDNPEIMLCTAHRSKGLEWPAVKLGRDWKDVDQMAGRYLKAQKTSDKHVTLAIEEYNALYVAATRPMRTLRGYERVLFPEDKAEPEPAIG